VLGTALATLVVGSLAACGGGTKQDAGEPTASFKVALDAAFPKKQAYAENQVFSLRVKNESSSDIPNVTATVDGFYDRSTQADMSDPRQAVWIVNQGPAGGVTALTNTWALGRVPAHKEQVFVWRVTPMQAGVHAIHYRVDASLYGKSSAVLTGGGEPKGQITVHVSPDASKTSVDPATGDVVVTGSEPPGT
jgi:hypothetical protein